jgi:hypothetical protein
VVAVAGTFTREQLAGAHLVVDGLVEVAALL